MKRTARAVKLATIKGASDASKQVFTAGASLSKSMPSLSGLSSVPDETLVNAATSIQSHYRGMRLRKRDENGNIYAHHHGHTQSSNPFLKTMNEATHLVGQTLDKTKEKTLMAVLDSIGNLTKEALKDDDMPAALVSKLEVAHATVWAEVKSHIVDAVMASTSFEEAKFQRSLVRFRAKPPCFWPRARRFPQPYRWFRAKFLHTLMPSDGTFWTTFRDPCVWAIRAMMVLPVVSVLLFTLLLVFIDKRDEVSGIALVGAACCMRLGKRVAWNHVCGILDEVRREECETTGRAGRGAGFGAGRGWSMCGGAMSMWVNEKCGMG